MIDLRSDTLTMPNEGMRNAMANARVGDDVYAEDPDVNLLQERVSGMFGKEAGLFVPSGTMGNQIALALHANTGDEIIADADAHIFHYENAAASVVARAQLHPVKSHDGCMPIDQIEAAIRPTAYYYPKTALIAIENTHNRHGGTVLPLEYVQRLRRFADTKGLPIHCDGARLWNALATAGYSAKEFGDLVDTMCVCMSKGAGAPVGSVLIGSQDHIDRARRWRKMLGGGMRQSGILAAAALYSLDTIVPHLAEDHHKAVAFANALSRQSRITIDLNRVQSNIVAFEVQGMSDNDFVAEMKKHGVVIATIKPGVMRAVFYHQVSMQQVEAAANAVTATLQM